MGSVVHKDWPVGTRVQLAAITEGSGPIRVGDYQASIGDRGVVVHDTYDIDVPWPVYVKWDKMRGIGFPHHPRELTKIEEDEGCFNE